MTFEAESEYLYQKKIEELQALLAEKDKEIERLKFELEATDKVYRMNREYVESAKSNLTTAVEALEKLSTARQRIMVGGVGDILNPPNNREKWIGMSPEMMMRVATEALARIRKGEG